MSGLIKVNVQECATVHRHDHEGYECYQRTLVPRDAANHCTVHVYEIPPGKSAFPYHYHALVEEAFYIISGKGVLRSPKGEQQIAAGDFMFFPAGEAGAHKLTNNSSEPLVYIDFDTSVPLEAAFYPDSGKMGVFGAGVRQIYRTDSQTDYYDGE